MKCIYLCILSIIIFAKFTLWAQNIDSSYCRISKPLLWTTYATTYTISMAALYFVWYDDYTKTSFHWFDDIAEWQQMDKMGHTFTAYQLNRLTHTSMILAGYNRKQSLFYSAGLSLLLMNSIELFDGYSEHWGASYSDILSNLAGILMFSTQEYFFEKQPLSIKFSFHFTPLAKYRPEILGKSYPERMLKDYNGQTYWLNLNISSIFKKFKAKWLNISFGYSAYNMLSARHPNIYSNVSPAQNELRYNKLPYRRLFVSVDIVPQYIKTSKKWVRNALKIFNNIKLPFPAFEINIHQFYVHPIYF